jgi:hypothetical protein
VRAIRGFLNQHPRLVNGLILAFGMTLVILAATQDKGLAAIQVAWLVMMGLGLASLCAWIMGR